MKKVLLLAIALFSLGIASNVMADSDYGSSSPLGKGYYGYDDYTTPPKLTGDPSKVGFRNDWNQAKEFGVKPIKVGDEKIEVKTTPGAIIRIFYSNSNPSEKVELFQSEIDQPSIVSGDRSIPATRKIKITLSDYSGKATFPLSGLIHYKYTVKNNEQNEKYDENTLQLKYGDKITVISSLDGWTIGSGNWTVGESLPKDIEEKDEAEIQSFINKLEQKEQEREEQQKAEEAYLKYIEYDNNQPWYKRLRDGLQDQLWNFKDWLKN
ncbi:hypothetical protein [Streptococcus porcinus]